MLTPIKRAKVISRGAVVWASVGEGRKGHYLSGEMGHARKDMRRAEVNTVVHAASSAARLVPPAVPVYPGRSAAPPDIHTRGSRSSSPMMRSVS
jgi:hypothetical protein